MRARGCGRENHGHVWAWCRNPTHYTEEECAWCGKDFESGGSTPVVFLEDENHYHMGCLVDSLQYEVASRRGYDWELVAGKGADELPEQGRPVKVILRGEGGTKVGLLTERGWLVWNRRYKLTRVADGGVEFWAPLK